MIKQYGELGQLWRQDPRYNLLTWATLTVVLYRVNTLSLFSSL